MNIYRIVNVTVRLGEHRCLVTKRAEQRCHGASQLLEQRVVPTEERAFGRIEDVRVTGVPVTAVDNPRCRLIGDLQAHSRFLRYRSRGPRRGPQRSMVLCRSRSDGDSCTSVDLGTRLD